MILDESYPVFEANQVLTHEHLNRVVEFLEQHDRRSRRLLSGVGIACGFAVTRSGTSIRIERGVAVTSAGFLVHAEIDTTYPYAVPFIEPTDYFGAGVELLELREVAPASNEDGIELASQGTSFFDSRAVVIHVENREKDLDDCIADRCDQQGQVHLLRWRPLLVPTDALLPWLRRALGLSSTANLAAVRAAAAVPFSLVRATFDRCLLASSDGVSKATLVAKYAAACRATIERLGTGMIAARAAFPRIFESFDGAAASTKLADTLTAALAGDSDGIQQVFDHLRCVAAALDEAQDRAFEWVGSCLPAEDLFPSHVMLASASPSGPCPPDPFRNRFVPAPVLSDQERVRAEARSCVERLSGLVWSFAVRGLANAPDVRITPSASLDRRLAHRAIPFYYPLASVRTPWNFELRRRCRSAANRSYDSAGTGADPTSQPLAYSIDDAGMLRVEGHLGRPRSEVVTALESLRAQWNLDFDIVTVRFGAASETERESVCSLADLEAAYVVTRAELLCAIDAAIELLGRIAEKPKDSLIREFVDRRGKYGVEVDLRKLRYFAVEPSGVRIGEAPSRPIAAPERSVIELTGRESALASTTTQFDTGTIAFVFDLLPKWVLDLLDPQARAEALARELLARLTATREALPEDVESFTAATLETRCEETRTAANNLLKAVTVLFASNGYEAKGFETEFVAVLEGLLECCVVARIAAIAGLLEERAAALEDDPSLGDFIKEHPGLEHIGGVPRGGTFVVVHDGDAREVIRETVIASATTLLGRRAESLSAKRPIAGLQRKSSASRIGSVGGLVLGQSLDSGVRARLESAIDRQNKLATTPMTKLLERLAEWREALEMEAQVPPIVRADFALTYRCVKRCAEVRYVVVTEATIAIERLSFCRADKGRFPVTVVPPGGTVEGPGVLELPGGGWAFDPSQVDLGSSTRKTITLTHRHPLAGSASLQIEVSEPPSVRIVASGTMVVNGEIVLSLDPSGDLDSVHWECTTDGSAADGAEWRRTWTKAGDYQVQVEVARGACRSRADLTLKISDLAVTLRIEGDRTEFCSTDERRYGLIGTPTGGDYTSDPPGVVGDSFSPLLFDGGPERIKVIYTKSGVSASLDLTVIQAPRIEFRDRQPTGILGKPMVFQIALEPSDGVEIEWAVDRDVLPGATGTKLEHTFQKPGSHVVQVTAGRGGCKRTASIEFAVLQRENDGLRDEALPRELERLTRHLASGATSAALSAIFGDSERGVMLPVSKLVSTLTDVHSDRLALDAALRGSRDDDVLAAATAASNGVAAAFAQGRELRPGHADVAWTFLNHVTRLVARLAVVRPTDVSTGDALAKSVGVLAKNVGAIRRTPAGRALTGDRELGTWLDAAEFRDRPVLGRAVEGLRKALG